MSAYIFSRTQKDDIIIANFTSSNYCAHSIHSLTPQCTYTFLLFFLYIIIDASTHSCFKYTSTMVTLYWMLQKYFHIKFKVVSSTNKQRIAFFFIMFGFSCTLNIYQNGKKNLGIKMASSKYVQEVQIGFFFLYFEMHSSSH